MVEPLLGQSVSMWRAVREKDTGIQAALSRSALHAVHPSLCLSLWLDGICAGSRRKHACCDTWQVNLRNIDFDTPKKEVKMLHSSIANC